MPNYAVLNGKEIINTIIAESLETAEASTGFTCVEYTTELAETGGSYDQGVFIPRSPFPSWKLKNGIWEAPKQVPDLNKIYDWDEQSVNWVERK